MNCPACSNPLHQMTVSDIQVDVCRGGCGGIWFDNFELKKFDEPHESAGQALLNIKRNPKLNIDHTKRLKCPKCDNIVMMRHFFSVKKQVVVDQCPGCGGYWLDAGELTQIRGLYDTEAEREKAADEYFSEIFDNQLAQMKRESEAELNKSRKIANIFRFICPSYYIPGKQDWAAF
jgi:Zn-finger nucleic acid-binding protein